MELNMKLSALAINCSLKPGRRRSSTQKLLEEVLTQLKLQDVKGEILRAADYNVLPGVEHDEGKGDEWPRILEKIRSADIFVLGTPIWMGQPSSIAKRICERMDAFLDDTDANKRMIAYGKVAGIAVVGNEDGAHHVAAEMFQVLNDVGFSLAPSAMTYWVGLAMGDVNYIDLEHAPRKTAEATEMMALNMVHLAQTLKSRPYHGKA
jgi:multimeric flavodoxin WrbA